MPYNLHSHIGSLLTIGFSVENISEVSNISHNMNRNNGNIIYQVNEERDNYDDDNEEEEESYHEEEEESYHEEEEDEGVY
jgi:hypothetical protein